MIDLRSAICGFLDELSQLAVRFVLLVLVACVPLVLALVAALIAGTLIPAAHFVTSALVLGLLILLSVGVGVALTALGAVGFLRRLSRFYCADQDGPFSQWSKRFGDLIDHAIGFEKLFTDELRGKIEGALDATARIATSLENLATNVGNLAGNTVTSAQDFASTSGQKIATAIGDLANTLRQGPPHP